MTRRARYVLALAIGLATASCTSLPDTSGYTAATTQLRNSAALAGDILMVELKRGIDVIPDNAATSGLPDASKQFAEGWGKTVQSLDALSRYATSIEQLTAAGNGGGAAAEALGDSLKSLVGAVGLAPLDAAGNVILEAGGMFYREIANARAARSVQRSLESADPIIQEALPKLVAQTSTAERLFGALISEQRNSVDRMCDQPLNVERSLDELALQIAAEATVGPNPGIEADALRLRTAREAIAPHLADCAAAVAALDAREREGRALFSATRTALQAWRSSHTQLLTAIRERRPVNVQSVLAASEDVRTLVTRWREL